MGVIIGRDAAKSGKNIHFLVIVRVRISHKIGLPDLTNRNQFKKVNGQKQRAESVHDYCGMRLMLHTPSIYYRHNYFVLMAVCPGKIASRYLSNCCPVGIIDPGDCLRKCPPGKHPGGQSSLQYANC